MLYTVYVAVCLASTPIKDCNQNTAQDWMVAPGTFSLSYCMVHGQKFAAESHMVRNGEYAKIFCQSLTTTRAANVG
ncbi:hypothetical protein [Polymorphum gilvum]|uniref:Uncharacterized protein n=1 Tax=Polymorphum gilvum (strain LMG 25793 / CGMCC 1.9160 / SL003B-26A1) TaxID=991905 RepID=F2IV30_POLGS|nr:hypothetical protein [Polymorphum gilvum]ADZ71361.1 hypothetical protein SL003B_2938 [Polymorphum gilvum SL003B-26A1]